MDKKEYYKQYYLANKELIKERSKRYYNENKEHLNYYNKDKAKICRASYYAANKEKIKKRSIDYYYNKGRYPKSLKIRVTKDYLAILMNLGEMNDYS
jgi:hypothetical protein